MGKDSLIKSTTSKAGKKTASKKKSTPPKVSAAQNNTPVQAKTTPNPKKAKPKSALKDILFKQFVDRQAPSPLPPPDYGKMSAPPIIDSGNPKEAARLRNLLLKHHDIDALPAEQTIEISTAQAPLGDEIAPAPPVEELQARHADSSQEQPQAPVPQADQIAPAPPIAQYQAPSADNGQAQVQAPTPLTLPSETGSEQHVRAAEGDQIAPAPPIAQSTSDSADNGTKQPQAPAPLTDQIAPAPPVEQSQSAGIGSASIPPAPDRTGADPVQRAAKLVIAVFALFVILIVWASISNSFKYFIVPSNGSVEIWKGDFSPAGKKFLAILHGVRPDGAVKDSYQKQEIYTMIFTYYLEKADALLEVDGLPDYRAIGDYLQRADNYALNKEMRNAVDIRRNNIRLLSLLYKADIDAGRGTAESLQSALQDLKQARQLTADPAQSQVIEQKIARAMDSLAQLSQQETGTPKTD